MGSELRAKTGEVIGPQGGVGLRENVTTGPTKSKAEGPSLASSMAERDLKRRNVCGSL